MNYRKVLGQYNRSSVETAGKMDLVIMCYEKTIQFLNQARAEYREDHFEQKANKMQKALDIINELRCSLNFEKGGQVAKNLEAIYIYLNKRLLDGDVKKDLTAFDEAIGIMSELKEAWEGIASDSKYQFNTIATPSPSEINATQIAA